MSLQRNSQPLPEFVTRIALPGAAKRAVTNLHIHAIDAGWTSRTPLKTHVVVCGFPRAGTTLLALMLQVAYRGAKAFSKEHAGLRVAYRTDRNHALMLSKRPDDIFYLDALRQVYRHRKSDVRFILMMRDPRSVLTSMHASMPGGYYVSVERWRAIYHRVWTNRPEPDCLLIRFEDMVADITAVQRSVVHFVGEEPQAPFECFVENVPKGFKATALNGVRSLDAAAIQKWRDPCHANRIAALLRDCPELPNVLIDTEYERDTTWTARYRTADMLTKRGDDGEDDPS